MPVPFPEWILEPFSVFLDRDGVLNEEIPGDYVRKPEQLNLYAGVAERLSILQPFVQRQVVITNQRGIGRGLMTVDDLSLVHQALEQQLGAHGVKLDGIFFCPDVDSQSPCRKPNTGMGMQALAQYPDIEFSRSIFFGNSLSDMEFGKRLNMFTCFLQTTKPDITNAHPMVDVCFPSLVEAIDAMLVALNPRKK